MLPHIITHEHR